MRQPARNPNEGAGGPKPIHGFLGPRACRLARGTTRTGKPPKVASAELLLNELSAFRPSTFENRFSREATRLRLASSLNRAELISLFEAAFAAHLCNIAFNGLGGCRAVIRPDRERHRIRLEQMYMTALGRFCIATGYQALSPSQKTLIHNSLLKVAVSDNNLAK